MLSNFGFGEVHVNLHALFEEVCVCSRVAEHELAHHAVGGEFVEVAGAEVQELVVLGGLHDFDSLVVLRVHRLHAGLQRFVFRADVLVFEFREDFGVGAGGDVREGRNRLQLRRAFVNGGDACVSVQALASVFEHVARTAVHLDAVVGVQVGVFGVHTLGERSAGAGELVVKLHLGLFFVGQLAFAFDVFETLVHVHVAGGLVQECAASVKASLDVGNHLVHGREVHDFGVELLAVLGVGEGFVVGHLADAHGLCGNA